jgi:hypothetical protein
MTVGKLHPTALAEFNNIFNLLSINTVKQHYG